MIHTDMPNKKIHQGRNIKRFREMLGIKQDALAYELGEDWNQKKISLLEQKESVEKDILEQVAKILKVPTEAIENFDEDSVVNIVTNTFSDFKDNAVASPVAMNYQCTFNPIDKIVELHEEKIALYERMLKEKDDMMVRLEKLIEGK
ncbi:transcriptional regulator [Elizabethkingia anophelis]|uniref:helix-turn-helix domain-containing protein n=3 Tax=Elizabethkingia anophelis TaxID=1117645 RepID=UPI000CE9A0CC|nr:helix-turn-helix transcriptional regulator [Elizabethkingia anophelis]AVF48860.1 transcriptional regulator [Elizabethkingia anophelis]AVF52856.1 transcriptional regulator [Elizabethkingia anophelis]MBG0506521.1 helix-turn-helix transcriptional regulator [Elizabethkingia anophelis]MCT3804180.1 helix-turn-helix transcriptional regulator [Elizabethkingia anophelis]MCT3810916.1 helix-turn-helix transcriptional regulator [Elizabethkingia anophelis]